MLANGNFWFAYMLANGHFWFAYMLANGSHLLTCEQMLFGLPTCWQTKELIKGFLANQKPILSVDLLANFAKVEVPTNFVELMKVVYKCSDDNLEDIVKDSSHTVGSVCNKTQNDGTLTHSPVQLKFFYSFYF